MPRFRYIGDDVRDFPSIGVYDVHPGDEFETDRVVSSALVVTAGGEPSHLDEAGRPVGDTQTNADPDPRAGLAPEPTLEAVEEPIAAHTFEDLSFDELYALAQHLDIAGRSKMDKPELLVALREAATTTPEELAAAEAAIDEAVRAVGQTETDPAGGADDDPEE